MRKRRTPTVKCGKISSVCMTYDVPVKLTRDNMCLVSGWVYRGEIDVIVIVAE